MATFLRRSDLKTSAAQAKLAYVKHVLAHIKALHGEKVVCPVARSIADGILCNCSCLELMDAKELQDHLEKTTSLSYLQKEAQATR